MPTKGTPFVDRTTPPRHDAHTHVWHRPTRPERVPEGLAGDVASLLADLDRAGVQRAAVITPRSMDWDDSYTLDVAAQHPERLAAVVRCDLDSPGAAAELRDAISVGARGVRIAADDGPLARLLDDDVAPVLDVLRDTGIALHLHSYPDGIADVAAVLDRLPDHPVLLDHMGRPDVAAGTDDPALRAVLDLAAHPGLHLKTPDVPYFAPTAELREALVPILVAALDAYGAGRVLWSSDWPLCTRDDGYDDVIAPVVAALEGFREDERDLVWRGNFERIFGDV